jgi:S1-C subfamily serine protease
MVISLEKGSPTAIAGVEEGNIVVGGGDHPVPGIDDLQRLLTEEQVGIASTLVLLRGRTLPVRRGG